MGFPLRRSLAYGADASSRAMSKRSSESLVRVVSPEARSIEKKSY